MTKKKTDEEKEREELIKELESYARNWLDYIERMERGELDEETIKRFEYIAGKALKLHKIIKKAHNGEDLTNDEVNLYLDVVGNDEHIEKYLKPPDVL